MAKDPYLVHPGSKSPLKQVEPNDKGPFNDKDEADGPTGKNRQKLTDLQRRLYAEGKRSLLVVLQGMDTSGKDGTISHVFSGVNPQGCSVISFKVPSAAEMAHDYLWRIHAEVPACGMISIFNRSHYESVLVERVHKIVPREIWSRRFDQINNFERLLVDEGTTILKFFLHISKDEQKLRLEKRLDDPRKNWKFSPLDLKERELWNDYQEAYNDALRRCSTEAAPWYIIPANHKWFRNWLVSEILVRTLDAMDPRFPPAPKGVRKWKII